MDSVCFTEKLRFLKYINEHYLFYSITLLTFAGLFSLVWILKKYTYFEKHKIVRATIPTFPYGNFGDVIKQENSLHVFLWKHYNRFKRKKCKYGGLFLFTKPVFLLVDPAIASNINSNKSYVNIFPYESKLDPSSVKKVFSTNVLTSFVEKFNYSVKGALTEKLLKSEVNSVLKDFLLESINFAFGFKSTEMVEEINQLLIQKYETSVKYYLWLWLCIPFLQNTRKKLGTDLKEILVDIMEDRKKNDVQENDLIQSFFELYNEANYTMDDIANEVFNIFADTLMYSYSTIVLCLYELADNQEIQQEVIGEIRRFNKKNREFTYENLEELVYLDAIIKETLRKYPPIATIIRLKSSKDDTVNGLFPDKDSLIFQSVLGIHRDPQYYIKPEAFDPDRFLEKRISVKDTFIPFGLGVRSQLYMKFVTLQATLILASIFSYLEVNTKEGVNNAFKYNPKLLNLSPSEDLNLSFTRI